MESEPDKGGIDWVVVGTWSGMVLGAILFWGGVAWFFFG